MRWTVSSSHVSRRWCSGFIQRSRLSFMVSLFSWLYDRSINASHEGLTTRQTARKRITSTPKMSGTTSANMHRMKKDESFLGKLGGTLVRKKRSKEGWSPFIITHYILLILCPGSGFLLLCLCPWRGVEMMLFECYPSHHSGTANYTRFIHFSLYCFIHSLGKCCFKLVLWKNPRFIHLDVVWFGDGVCFF